MKMNAWLGVGTLAVGLAAFPGLCGAQEHRMQDLKNLPSPGEALRDLQNTGRLLFVMADVNHDGQVSQQEAVDAGDLLVGGFFFRADTDGNGVVTDQEARAAVNKYLDQNPWVKYVVESLRNQAQNQSTNGQNNGRSGAPSIKGIVALVDTNRDNQLESSELRQFVQTATQSFYAAADTNHDGLMSPAEVNAAVAGMGKAAAQQAFLAADTDGNGQLSRNEYDKALIEPANVFFQIIDLNHDGQLSQQETQQIAQVIVNRLRTIVPPEPPNSPTNIIESGRMPNETAPVPSFAAPGRNPNQGQPQPVVPR
jgi:Ca2+-binding EF-hand superfamily protein